MTATVPWLDRSTITSLAAPTGGTGTTRAIFVARYLPTLVGLRGLAALLAEQAPALWWRRRMPCSRRDPSHPSFRSA